VGGLVRPFLSPENDIVVDSTLWINIFSGYLVNTEALYLSLAFAVYALPFF
jgi:hypothetical protein